MAKDKPLEEWSLEELEAKAADLAAQKVAIKAQEREVSQAISYQKAMAGLPEELRKRIGIAGGISAQGGQA